MTKKPIPPASELVLPEFSRLIDVTTLPSVGIKREIEARPAEREALARRFGIIALSVLTARLDIQPIKEAGMVGARVQGEFKARVTQNCVVTLEPFESDVAEPIELDLLPPEAVEGDEAAGSYLNEAVEPLEGDRLDLGELVAQHLSLALDPYPRRPGAQFEPVQSIIADSEASPGIKPFATLGDLKRKM